MKKKLVQDTNPNKYNQNLALEALRDFNFWKEDVFINLC